MMKLSTLRKRHAQERRALLREALEAAGWTYQKAGVLLGCSTSTVQMAVSRDEILRAEYLKKGEHAGIGGRPPL